MLRRVTSAVQSRYREWRESLGERARERAALKRLTKLVDHYQKRAIKSRYESAQTTDENSAHWTLADEFSPSQSLTPIVRNKIRKRARYEARENNSYANGICNTIVDELLGKGPTIQFPDLTLKDSLRIQREFRQWMDDCGIHQKIRQMALAEIIEGESLGVLVFNANSKNPVKLDLQTLEPDYLEPKYLDTQEYPDAIKFDEFGNPVAYHILSEHPGSGYNLNEGTWYPAESIIHHFRQERAGQVRGVSRLAPCLTLFSILRRFTLATVEAAETAASFAAILYSDPDPGGAESLEDDEWFDAIPIIHRALMTIPKGWKASQMKAEHPSSTYAEFKRELMNEICRCLCVPLNIALANSSGYNYSSGQLDHLTFYRMIAVEQQRYERSIYDRLFREWYREAYLLNDDIVPRGKNARPDTIHWIYTWDTARHADPLKAAMAEKELVAGGLKSLAQYYAERNKNWEEEINQIAKERKLLLQKGVTLDIIMPTPEPAGPSANSSGTKPADKPKEEKPKKARRNPQSRWNSIRRQAYEEILNGVKTA